MSDVIKFTAYHGTCSKYRPSIERFGFSPDQVAYREDHWLGQGVYFFESKELAEWWANDQSRKPWNKGTQPLVYSCNISVSPDQYLDLDNAHSMDNFLDYCTQLIRRIDEDDSLPQKPVFTDKKFRALLFDYYKEANNISVIAHTFQKKRTSFAKKRSSAELDFVVLLESVLDIGYKERQICVSSKACLGPPPSSLVEMMKR